MNGASEASPADRRRPVARRIWSREASGLERGGAAPLSLAIILVVGLLGWLQVLPNGLLALALFGVALYEFEKRIDRGLPLMQIAALLAVLQWVVGPAMAYGTELVVDRYVMYVEEREYFAYAMPGTAAYMLGMLSVGFSIKQRNLLRGAPRRDYTMIGLLLFGISLLADFMSGMVPGGLAFLFHLLTQLRYVAALYFLFSRNRYRWWMVGMAILLLVRESASSAMFHDLLLWAGMIFCYWYGMRPRSRMAKVVMLVIAGLVAFTIQGIKQEYRTKKWQGQEVSLIGTAVGFWTDSERTFGESVLSNVIMRLNQGWIISAVMNHVPDSEPYARGETVVDALNATLVPRFLNPDKKKAGGQEYFRRFTGLPIGDTTSMAVSPLGEAYANFGRTGGVVLMGVGGLMFSLGYAFCLRHAARHPDFLLWVPLIFYQAIKAETEFVTVLNQVTKGAIVAFGAYWGLRTVLLPMLRDEGPTRRPRRSGLRRKSATSAARSRAAPDLEVGGESEAG